MDFILDAVTKYISLPQSNYALQINGEWGTGKTFYVKNNLVIEIEKMQNRENINYKCCYISLNGFSEVNEIGEAVFLELAGGTNKVMYQGAKLLGKYGGILNAFGDFTKVTEAIETNITNKLSETSIKTLNDVVLIFDDLERIDDKLSLKQVLGYINSNYIESHQIKVLFISNDRKINELKSYTEIKEKIIGKTIEFRQDNTEIIENIAQHTYSDYTKFLSFFQKEKEELIPTIIQLNKNINLRTLRFVFDTFIVLQEDAIKNDIVDHDIHKSIFLNVLVVSKEYKEGKVSKVKELDFLHGRHQFKNISIYSKDKNEYEDNYIQQYHTNDSNYFSKYIHYFESVSQYIIVGFLDSTKFKIELRTQLEFQNKSMNQDSNKKTSNIQILNAFNYYEERIVKKAQLEVINQIREGTYSCPEIIEITSIFLNLRDLGIVFEEIEDAESTLFEAFSNQLSTWNPSTTFYEWDIRNRNLHNEVAPMIELLKARYNNSDYANRKQNVIELFNAMISDELTSEKYKKVEYENEFFKILDDLDFLNYLSKSNRLIATMNSIFSEKYLKVSNASDFIETEEIEHIKKIIKKIQEYLHNKDSSLDTIKKYNLNKMLDQLFKVKTHLREK